MVPEERLELTRAFTHWILSPARLPIPPLRRTCTKLSPLIAFVKRGRESTVQILASYDHCLKNER